MKAFISYSTSDKKIAGSIKNVLDELSIEAFLAHEDINVSQVWKNRILEELENAQIIILILSEAFRQSDWAAQEIGLAYARRDEILFIPLSVDGTIPFGFISHIQSESIPDDGRYLDLLIEPIIDRHPHEVIPGLIKRMAGARSFLSAEALMLPLVPHFDKFDVTEVGAFANASIDNGQIWDAAECRSTYLPQFIGLNRSKMSSESLKALEYQIDKGRRYAG